MIYCWDASTSAPMRQRASELRAAGITTWLGAPPALDGSLRSCTIVKSPGIAFDVPLLRGARALGLEVLDELELGWRVGRAPVVAVTGTNGKSTVCSLLCAIARAAGRTATIAGNAEFHPPLSAVAASDPELIVCEVSSYQLEGCTAMIPDAAVLTNIRPDHLNRHGTIDAYAACKRSLFVRGEIATPLAVLNVDDERGAQLAAEVRARGGMAVGYGRSATADFRLRRCGWSLTSGWLELDAPGARIALRTRLPGPHNAENVAGAVAAACSLGFDLEAIVAAIERAPAVPGRLERIDEGQPFDVLVDLAHTPDAVSVVIGTARAIVRERRGARLHVLVSVAGQRMPALSAPIGEAAARLADRVVLTEGSSYGRSRDALMAPLIEGASSVAGATIEIVPDRRAAIRRLLALAARGDVALVLGRGAIPRLSLHLDGTGIAFDDRAVVRSELQALLA